MTAAERKKIESKRRRAEAKAKADAAKGAGKDSSSGGGAGKGGKKTGKEKPVDDDPDGAALADVDDPLEKVHQR